ncbi:hypothetical protein PT7_1508 [Pusillimonas sp. T7-7]|uniref:hypothetical protein n=1 Tax=Pusillimonas sp. (strain T7-7) TaxID=1007105 RepID=UPI0002084DD9|nr:hypothetical protein [Pusillimonas sp. T7-7]AEC20048.1 hypothetical protein PT7_1508 [Pusillimonas sp. T7-7]
MKVWIILLSMTAAAGTWWWHARYKTKGRHTMKQRLKIATSSFIAGVGVYFVLMAVAFIYLMLTGK